MCDVICNWNLYGYVFLVKAGGMRITQHKSPKTDDKHLLDDNDINNAGLKVSTRLVLY